MVSRSKITILIFLLAVIGGGWLVADYQAKAVERRDTERRAAVETLKRELDARENLPTTDGVLRAEATGGLTELGSLPELPEDASVNYAVDPESRSYFVCTELERGGAFYANRHGTFAGPPESCRPDADPVAVDYVLDAKMTSVGARAFLRSNPAFVSKQFIQRECAASADDGQLQGCFVADRIYLIDLPDQQIRPEVSVTAAHEMLHAAWEALDEEERSRLTPLLEDLIERSPKLKEKIGTYDDASRITEAHSAAGTELEDVGDELERHYAKYLRDRGMIVRRHLAYEKVLDDLNGEIERLRRELAETEARADALLAAGNIAAYNALVDPYNALVDEVNRKIEEFNRLTEHTRPDGGVPTVEMR